MWRTRLAHGSRQEAEKKHPLLGAFLVGCFFWVLFKKTPGVGCFFCGAAGKAPKKSTRRKKHPLQKKSTQALVSYYLGVVWGAKAAERPRCLW